MSEHSGERVYEYESYVAARGTVFTYKANLEGRVAVVPERTVGAAVPIEDLVEFVEVIYHGSEWPTAGGDD